MVNKKSNRIYGSSISVDYTPEGSGSYTGVCSVNAIKNITDSLYEVKASAVLYTPLYEGQSITAGPMFHYLVLKNDKLVEMHTDRTFAFTKFIKMDDSYLKGCYQIDDKTTISKLTPAMLRYMKNEIYADYNYRFKDTLWQKVFSDYDNIYRDPEKRLDNVDDSLTAIDKYNIAFIEQKLKGLNNKKPPLELNKNKALAAQ